MRISTSRANWTRLKGNINNNGFSIQSEPAINHFILFYSRYKAKLIVFRNLFKIILNVILRKLYLYNYFNFFLINQFFK